MGIRCSNSWTTGDIVKSEDSGGLGQSNPRFASILRRITSERRLLEEVRMHLACRWFSRLGFEQEIPDHSTFSKNRHGRFRQSGVFRKVFEEIVQRCLEAGLVEGRNALTAVLSNRKASVLLA